MSPNGVRTLQCADCGERFQGARSFELHVSEEGCFDPAGITLRDGEAAMEQRADGVWRRTRTFVRHA